MKKILLTLARWFNIDLTEIKYVEVEKVVEKKKVGTVKEDVAKVQNAARRRNAKGQFVKEG